MATRGMSFNTLKEKALKRLGKSTEKFILAYYPDWKQKSDNVDIQFWTTWLVHYSADGLTESDIRKNIYYYLSEVDLGNITFDEAMEQVVPDDDAHTHESLGRLIKEREAWEQIAKAALRQSWVQKVKTIYNTLKYQIDENATDRSQLDFVITLPGAKTSQGECVYPELPDYLR